MVGRILQDRVGFGDGAVAIDCGWDGGIGVDFKILLALVLAGEVVDGVEVVFGAEQIQAGQHLSAVDRAGIEIDFKHGWSLTLLRGNNFVSRIEGRNRKDFDENDSVMGNLDGMKARIRLMGNQAGPCLWHGLCIC